MNVTFLVGNGFDIACDIDTSYKAFCNWYLQRPNPAKSVKFLKSYR